VTHQVDLLVGNPSVVVQKAQHLGHIGSYRWQLLGHTGIADIQGLATPVQDYDIEIAPG